MSWAEACQAMLEGKSVERSGPGGIRIRLDSEGDVIFDDVGGIHAVVNRVDLEATDWREVRR